MHKHEVEYMMQDRVFKEYEGNLPDYQQRRKYHHLPELDIYTYKQDYGNIFISSGLYKEIYRHTFNHDENRTGWASSSQRGVRVALRKMKENEYYTLA